ncbi:hypothetical protein AVEN_1122-1 [Araneus ventricosus]|uniref:Uncharacterized protein n=1 Tax=Araneus ventricosus TaxID=182803 RepID=A0A4Y2G450_ARAVE|nr:hypothetical protein AVEN_1122-1 [Araneus ventricosus]
MFNNVLNTVKPVYNDIVYDDKPSYNNILLGTSRIPIYSLYFQPAKNNNHFLDSPVYNDNFTSLESWYSTTSFFVCVYMDNNTLWSRMSENRESGEGARNWNLLQQGDPGLAIGMCTDVSLPPTPGRH